MAHHVYSAIENLSQELSKAQDNILDMSHEYNKGKKVNPVNTSYRIRLLEEMKDQLVIMKDFFERMELEILTAEKEQDNETHS